MADITTPQEPQVDVKQPMNIDVFRVMANTGMDLDKLSTGIGPDDTFLLKSPEIYQEEFKDKFKTPEEFNQFYGKASDAYEKIRAEQFRRNIHLQGSENFGVGIKSPFFGYNQMNQAITETASVYNPLAVGNPLMVETPSQNAGRKGYFLEPEITIDKNTGESTVKDGKITQGKLSDSDKGLGGYYVTEEIGPDGRQITDEHGQPSFVYQKFSDGISHYNLEKASIWGDQKLYGIGILAPILGMVSSSSLDLLQSTAQLANVFGDAAMAVSGMSDEEIRNKKAKSGMSGYFDGIIEDMQGLKYRTSAEIEKQGMFGSWGAFSYKTGIGIGYILPQKFAVTALAKGAGIVNKAVLRGVATEIGASQAVNGFYRSARDAGIGETDAAYLSLMAMPAAAATEWMLSSKWLTNGLGESDQKIVTKFLKEGVEEAKLAGQNISEPAVQSNLLKRVFAKMTENPQLFKEGMSTVGYGAARLGQSALLEGTQEGTEEVWYGFLENAYDKGFFHDIGLTDGSQTSVGKGLFGTDSVFDKKMMSRYFENFAGGFIIGGLVDAMYLGQKDMYKEQIFEEMIIAGKTAKLLDFVSKSYADGKLGYEHKDINGNTILSDKDGNPIPGQEFEIPDDVVYNGKPIFKKGDKITTMNQMAYYRSVMDILSKDEMVKQSGLKDPTKLREFSGQSSLLTDQFEIWKQMSEIKTQIETLTKERTEENTEQTDAKIAELQRKIDDSGGLKERFDYLSKPATQFEIERLQKARTEENAKEIDAKIEELKKNPVLKSQAYIDNVKHGIVNGIKYNKDADAYENGKKIFQPISKDGVRQIDNFLGRLQDYRQQQKNIDDLHKDEFDIYTNINSTLSDLLDQKQSNIADFTTALSSALTNLKNIGVDSRTSNDPITKNIIESAAKYSQMVKDIHSQLGINEYKPGDEIGSLLDWANKDLEDFEQIIIDDPADRTKLTMLSRADKMLSELTGQLGNLKPESIREQGKLNPDLDKKNISRNLWTARNESTDPNVKTNDYNIEDKLNYYKNAQSIGNLDDLMLSLPTIAFQLANVDAILDYSEQMNEAKKNPNYKGILSAEKSTTIKDGDVDPGRDIPSEYINDLRAKNRELKESFKEVSKKVKYDGKTSSEAEKKRYFASTSQKAHMLFRMQFTSPQDFFPIAKEMQELNNLADELNKKDWTVELPIIDEVAKKIIAVEEYVYQRSKSEPGFFERLMNDQFVKNNEFERLAYNEVADSQLQFYTDSSGLLINVNDVTFIKLMTDDANIFKSVLFMKQTNYMNMIANTSSKSFYVTLDKIISKEDQKKPGIEQIEAIRLILTSSMITFSKDKDSKFLIKEAYPSRIIGTQDFDDKIIGITAHNALSIDGSGGVGKTTVITSLGLKVVNTFLMDSDIKANIVSVAPSEKLLIKLKDSISGNTNISVQNGYSYDNFIAAIDNKSISIKEKDYLIIDESSRINLADMGKISLFAKEAGIQVIYLGDSMQATELTMPSGSIPRIAHNQKRGIRGPRVNMKFRTGISEIGDVQDAIASTIKGGKTQLDVIYPEARYTSDHSKGVRYVATQREVEEAFVRDISTDPANRVIIFTFRTEADNFRNSLPEDLKKHGENVRYIFNNVAGVPDSNGTVQGLEFSKVYVSMQDSGSAIKGNISQLVYERRNFLTAMSRAENFAMIPAPDFVSKSYVVGPNEILDQSADLTQENNERATNVVSMIKMMAGIAPEAGEVKNKTTPKKPSSTTTSGTTTKKEPKKKEPVAKPDKGKKDHYHPLKGISIVNKSTGARTYTTDVWMLNGAIKRIDLGDGTLLASSDPEKELWDLFYKEGETGEPESDASSFFEEKEIPKANYSEDEDRNTALSFISSASVNWQSGGSLFPTMINVMEAEAGSPSMSVNEFFKRKQKSTTEPLNNSYDLVYMEKIFLYTRDGDNYSPKLHHHVIGVYNKKGELEGVLPSPDTEYADKEKTATKTFSSQKEIVYSRDRFDTNVAKMRWDNLSQSDYALLYAYHKNLIDLHTTGYEKLRTLQKTEKSNKVKIGSITYSPGSVNRKGAMMSITDNSVLHPTKLVDFVDAMETKGVKFKRVGNKLYVVQKNVDGKTVWHLEASYISLTDDRTSDPIDGINIPVVPHKIDKDDIKDIADSIAKLRKISVDDKQVFFKKLWDSAAFQTLRSNIKMLVDSNGRLNPQYAAFLTYENGSKRDYTGKLYLTKANATEKSKKSDFKAILSDLSAAIDTLLKEGSVMNNKGPYSWVPIDTFNGITTLSNPDILNTIVEDLHAPMYRGVITLSDELLSKDHKIDEETDYEEPDFLLNNKEGINPVNNETVIRRSKEDGIAYVTHVLGQEYVNNFLEINSESIKDGQSYWGYVQGLKMVLRATGNTVSEQAFKHEPIHIIMSHLMTKEKREKVIKAAREYLNKTETSKYSDGDIIEDIARINHNKNVLKTEYKGLKGLLKRFINALGSIFNNIRANRRTILDFLNDVEAGTYAGKVHASDKSADNHVQFLADVTAMNKQQKTANFKYNELSKIVGGYDRLNNMTRRFSYMVRMNSAGNNQLDENISSFKGSFEIARYKMEKNVKLLNLDVKMKDLKAYQLKTLLDDPDFAKYTISEIENFYYDYILSQGNNFNTVLKHKYQSFNAVTEEFATEINRGYQESAGADPELYASDLVKDRLKSIPYRMYDEQGKPSKESSARDFIDYDVLKGHIIRIMTDVSTTESTNFEEIFRALKARAEIFNVPGDPTDNYTRNTILSFLEEYGDVYNGDILTDRVIRNISKKDKSEYRPPISHYMMAYHTQELKEQLEGLRLSTEGKANRIKALNFKAQVSAQLLNAVFSSLDQRALEFLTLSIENTDDGDVYARNLFRETSTAEVKKGIRGGIENLFMTSSGMYLDSVKLKVNGEAKGPYYKFSKSNSEKEDHTIVRTGFGNILTYNKNTNSWEWFRNKLSDQLDDAIALTSFFGIKAKPSVINSMFINQTVKDKYGINGNDLANYYGHMITSIYNHPQWSEKRESNEKLRSDVARFLEDKHIGATLEQLEEGVMITDFYKVINTISDIQGYLGAKINPNFSMTIDGKAKSNKSLPSALLDRFSNVENGYASDKISKKVYNEVVKDVSASAWNTSPWVFRKADGTPVYTEPLLDRNENGFKIASIIFHSGITGRYGNTNINEMTPTDYANSMINGLFRDSVFNGYQNQLLAFSSENLGDSGQLPIFHVSFGNKSEKLIDIIRDKTGVKAVVGEHIINRNLDKIFDYHYKASLISVNSWYKFLSNYGNFKTKINQDDYLENQIEAIDAVRQEISKHLSSLNQQSQAKRDELMVEMARNKDLAENNDYVIDNGKIVLGNATRMVHEIFGPEIKRGTRRDPAKIYKKWKSLTSEAARTKFRDELFFDRYMLLVKEVDNPLVGMPKDVKDLGSSYYERTSEPHIGKSGQKYEKSEYTYHPFYKAFMYGYFIANNSISNMISGNEMMYEDAVRKGKLNKGYNSSGLKPILGGPLNLQTTSTVLRISDKSAMYEHFKHIFPVRNADYKATDGYSLTLPLEMKKLSHSLGGQYAMSKFDDVTVKSFTQGMKWLTHRPNQIKNSEISITKDLYNDYHYMKDLVDYMLTGGRNRGNNSVNLADVFREIQATEIEQVDGQKRLPTYDESWDQLHRWISMKDIEDPSLKLHDNYISMITFPSSNKIGVENVNNVRIEDIVANRDQMVVDDKDNTSLYYQLNLNHEVTDENSRANQVEAVAGTASDPKLGMLIDDINAAALIKRQREMRDEEDRTGGYIPFLRKLGVQSTNLMGKANNTGDLFANKNISISLPMILHTALGAYVSDVNNGVNTKTAGTKMVQQPSDFSLVTLKDSMGNTFLGGQEDALKYDKAEANESEITYTDENNDPCNPGVRDVVKKTVKKAEKGAVIESFTPGNKWEITEDLKGYPSHANGGVDLTIGEKGVTFKNNKNIDIIAAEGLVLPRISE